MLFLSSILNPAEENCINVLRIFAKELGIKVSKSGTRKILDHPSYPSLESISDLLKEWNVENMGLKVEPEIFGSIQTPFIAQLTDNSSDSGFVVVKSYSDEGVIISDYSNNYWQLISKAQFLQQATGIVMAAEVTEISGEKHYLKAKINERRQKLLVVGSILLVLASCVFSFIDSYRLNGTTPFALGSIFLLKLFGCYLCILLLWLDVDRHNPTLQNVCKASKKVNCGAILNSDAAKILDIGWSEIGFFYFAGSLLTLLFNGVSPVATSLLSWLTLLALPYTIFSIYYQWRIAKQWCILCLAVQAILLSEFIVAIIGGLYHPVVLSSLTVKFLINTFIGFFLPIFGWFVLKPLLKSVKENRINKANFGKLKYNAEIFGAMLRGQKPIDKPIDNLGIVIGSPNAKNKVIKVCNPYCAPCAEAHLLVEELLENNNDIQLQIIFAVGKNLKDPRTIAASHLIAIAGKDDIELTKQALYDWYSTGKNDFDAFSAKYPINWEIKDQGNMIDAMYDWCSKAEIYATPSFFINNHPLPKIYSHTDLKYFLTS
jgi:uncharacterized membrane protein